MKKLLYLIGVLAIPLWGATSTSNVTLSAQGAGQKQCLKSLDTEANNTASNYTVRLLSGDTTNYVMVMSTGTAFVKNWPEDAPFCGEVNQAVQIKNSGASFNINYESFVKKVYE